MNVFTLTGNGALYIETMLKGLGAALITGLCASVCRECGKGSLADLVELAGKLEILLLCLPLIRSVAKTAAALLSL